MTGSSLFVVTEVAPYASGPAGVHGVLPQAELALAQLGELCGLEPRVVRHVADLEPRSLAAGGVLALFTIGETPWSEAQRQVIVDSVRRGDLGVVGVHAATDACAGWADYGRLLGARFDGHPWTCDFDVEVVDSAHPATAHLAARWRWRDEVYLFRSLRDDARVLLRVDPDGLDPSVPGARVPDIGLPVAWCFSEGAGRVFYSALGHFPAAWEHPGFLQHLGGGMRWVLTGHPT